MNRHLLYFKYVMRHKWFVFWECMAIGGVPILSALIHDWDKFLPDEWFPYVNYFYGEKTSETKAAFDVACETHYKRNRHHWNHWLNSDKYMRPADMREMLADWRGTSRSITGKDDTKNWYIKNYDSIQMPRHVRLWVESQLWGRKSVYTRDEIAAMNNASIMWELPITDKFEDTP